MTATPSVRKGVDDAGPSTRTLVSIIASGAALMLTGALLFSWWGGLDELQTASDPEAFADAAVKHGNEVRWASWADIVLFVPGYVLLLGGVLALFRRRPDTPTAVRRASLLGTGAALAGGIADQVENAIVQLGLNAVDLSAADPVDVGRPSDALMTALHAATAGKYLFGGAALLVVVGLSLHAAFHRARGRTSEVP